MSGGMLGTVIRIIFIVLGFYLLYLIYDFLYSTNDMNDFVLFNGPVVGRGETIGNTAAKTFENKVDASGNETQQIFKIATGSEFSISFWIYYKEPTYLNRKNKFIFSLGPELLSDSEPQSLVVYLAPITNVLVVATNAVTPGANTNTSGNPLSLSKVSDLFKADNIAAPPLNNENTCNMTTIDLQKWVLVNIVSSQKTLDVYIDGKLGRSCILPSTITINKNYKMNMFNYNGFGGFVSNFNLSDYALNPEQIWRMYMAGPGFKYTLWEYIKSLFDPNATPASYKKPLYPPKAATK